MLYLTPLNAFKPSHLETEESRAIYESASIYYCAGFFLTMSVESLVVVAEHRRHPTPSPAAYDVGFLSVFP
jgi:hypothetical protein